LCYAAETKQIYMNLTIFLSLFWKLTFKHHQVIKTALTWHLSISFLGLFFITIIWYEYFCSFICSLMRRNKSFLQANFSRQRLYCVELTKHAPKQFSTRSTNSTSIVENRFTGAWMKLFNMAKRRPLTPFLEYLRRGKTRYPQKDLNCTESKFWNTEKLWQFFWENLTFCKNYDNRNATLEGTDSIGSWNL